MRWSDDRFETLKGLIDQGLSATQIGNSLGMSKNAVIGKVHRGGLVFSKRPGPQKKTPKPKTPRVRHLAPPQRPPPSSTELAAENLTDDAVTFAELAAHHCRWPVGDRYCGAAAVNGSSYCARHSWAAHHRVAP